MTRQIAAIITILSETSTSKTSYSCLAQRLFIIASFDWYEKTISTYEKETYLEEAENLTLEDIKKLFSRY